MLKPKLLCALAAVCWSCSGDHATLQRGGTVGNTVDGGTGLPEATTTGETKIAVLPDGGTVEVTTQPDGGLALADGGVVLGIDGGLTTSGLFSLKCDAGAIVVSGAPKTVQCRVLLEDGTVAQNAVWLTQDTLIGSVGSDGVFHASGWAGGVFVVTAKIGQLTISTKITVDFTLTENPGNISSTDTVKLAAGGSGGPGGVGPDGNFKWLYPYDKTVFPRGLPAPLLQFDASCSGATYLKLSLPHFVYEQFASATTPTQITIPETVWKGLTLSSGPTDWVNASVSKLCSGQATGPVSEGWLIAPGNLRGDVYYTTYQSPMYGGSTGAMRVRIGAPNQPDILLWDCTTCHSVSANGQVLASGMNAKGQVVVQSGTFDLTTGTTPPATRAVTADGNMFSFPALTPDGKRALTNSGSDVTGVSSPYTSSSLVDTATAQVIPAPSLAGLGILQTPSFSPDGLHVAFNHTSVGKGHLTVMDYDGAQSPPLFSNVRDVAVHSTQVLAWPSFLPDSKAVAYGESDTFATTDGLGELRLVEIGSGAVNSLRALNGYAPDGRFALTWGMAEDGQVDYEPTVLPRPIGGYFWVMFSSRRSYGNTISPGGTLGGSDRFVTHSPRKKVWVAAVDIDHESKADPSHPAFLLPGQELESGNLRPFVSLEPCRPQGSSCESGADCCDGFCRETGRAADGTSVLACVPPPESSCSNIDEACSSPSDCCDPTLLCLLGRCAIPTPVIR